MHTLPEPADFGDTSDAAADLPCAGGLIAGTLALMTTWASPEFSAPAEPTRPLLARKIVSNLFFLRHHPDLGEPMRRVIGKVHERWVLLAGASTAERGMH